MVYIPPEALNRTGLNGTLSARSLEMLLNVSALAALLISPISPCSEQLVGVWMGSHPWNRLYTNPEERDVTIDKNPPF